MSTITIENWKVTEDNSPEFQFVPPEYHVTYWEIPKWWYKGTYVCYTSCVRIDVGETSIYVDGTSPLMKFTLSWTAGGEGSASFTDWRCIDRAMILNKDNLGAVNRRESDEYIDVEFDDYFYKIRHDNYLGPDVIEPLQKDLKPQWVDGDNSRPFYLDPIPFTTGTFLGGVEPITYEYRHNEQDEEGGEWLKPTDYIQYDNTVITDTIQLDGKSETQYLKITCRATDAEGTVVYTNSPKAFAINNPLVTVTEEPVVSLKNQYEVGAEVVGFAGAFTGGVSPLVRARWQWRESTSDPFSSDEWTNDVEPLQEVRSSPIPVGMTQVRFQYQIVEQGTNTGSGTRNTNKSTPAREVTE